MIAALAYEFVRLRTVRSTWVLAAFAIGLSGLLAWPLAYGAKETGLSLAGWEQVLASAPSSFGPLLCSIVAVLAFGHEYRHGTIRPTLTALPRRMQVYAAKALSTAVYTAVVMVLCIAVTLAVARLVIGPSEFGPTSGDGQRILIGVVLFAVLNSLLALSLTALVRNQVAAIVALLVWPFVIEPVLLLVLQLDALDSVQPAGRFLPYVAGGQLYASTLEEVGSALFGQRGLSPLAGGLVFAAWTAAITVAGLVAFVRRDA